MNVTALIILGLLSLLFYLIMRRKYTINYKDLPGPPGWPLVGNLLSIDGVFSHHLFELGKKYGPIFRFRMGYRNIIILNSNRVVNKALKDMGANFSGRWKNIVVKIVNHNSGIVFQDGEWWSIQKNFLMKVLKFFGLGKERTNEIVNQECSDLIENIEKQCGNVISTNHLFSKATVNVISKFAMNMRFEKEDEKFALIKSVIEKILQKNNFFLTLILMYPVLEGFPSIAKLLLRLTGRSRQSDILHEFIKEIIDEHKKRFQEENEGEDLIDMFLKEQHQLEKDKVQNHTFTEWQLIRVLTELFAAGYETTSSTLTWSMLLMAKYPEIQERVHQELIQTIGFGRMCKITDKKSLTYTQAVIDEILRFSSVAPTAIAHRVLETAEINGFTIPKNSIVFPNLYACHREKNVWDKPFGFYPEHFLSTLPDGEIKYTPRSELIPFGIGKRQCLGESLARTEIFIFFTNILHRFQVRFEKPISEETFSKITKGTNGLIRAPLSSEVVFQKRSYTISS